MAQGVIRGTTPATTMSVLVASRVTATADTRETVSARATTRVVARPFGLMDNPSRKDSGTQAKDCGTLETHSAL